MTRVEPGRNPNGARTGRPVRGDRAVDRVGDRISERLGDRTVDRGRSAGYSHRGTGRSIDDVRGRGREALAATRGATALQLSPAVEPTRRRRPDRPDRPDRPAESAVRDVAPEPEELVDEHRPAVEHGTARATASGRPARRSAPAGGAGDRAGISVVPPLPVSAPRAPFVALVLSVVVVGVLGILVINTKINEGAFHLHDLKAQQGNLDQHEQRLQREIAEKESPGNLAAAARQLGLVRAESPAFLRLPDGRQLGVPKPASGPASVAGQPATQPAG
ncbi:hypothetical protein [Virgisporangium ochraceum]|uniref:Cell division protein FtsL n=1 Tax=Virgisporangium ochraceum TaxID=65505 RepID=A0A8J3ZV15_9ACTN|nr:hypothetical protein [Virgisporangium ochraceum]GIJ68633.1 hypothetical protein Voc01_035500 [Virgisporangium ochraceum]